MSTSRDRPGMHRAVAKERHVRRVAPHVLEVVRDVEHRDATLAVDRGRAGRAAVPRRQDRARSRARRARARSARARARARAARAGAGRPRAPSSRRALASGEPDLLERGREPRRPLRVRRVASPTSPSSTSSRTVVGSDGFSAQRCGTKPKRSRPARAGSIQSRPAAGVTSPKSARTNVVLPVPFRPTRNQYSPARISRFTSRSTGSGP